MLEQFSPQPDDTAELPTVEPRRPVALIVTAAVLGVAVLVGAGFLAFGNLGAGGGGGGIQSPGLLPAVSGPASTGTAPSSPAAAPVGTTPTSTPAATAPAAVTVSIANATMKPSLYVGTNCPGSTTAVATVIVNGPVTITYRWTSTRLGSGSGTGSYRFRAAGSHQFKHGFTNITTPDGQLGASFVVVSPVQHRASMVYTQKCGASVSRLSTLNDTTNCTVRFRATLRAGVGPMIVRYHWVIDGAIAAAGGSGQWPVPRGGGRKAVVSPIVNDQHAVTAKLVIDGPVRGQSVPATASCT